MKNIRFLLGALLIITFAGCKKDETSNSTLLTGTWTMKQYGSANIINEYRFFDNDSVQSSIYQIDTLTNKVLGTSYRMKGYYQVTGNSMTINERFRYASLSNSFVPDSELIKYPSTAVQSVPIDISNENIKPKLLLYFTCPAGLLCAPTPSVYYKQ